MRAATIAASGGARAGDCVDCTLCVQACPTGIDIRNGLQYECIACAACIDACDTVMDKLRRPRGLIRYTTEHAQQGRATHIIRPRMFVYAGLLTLIGALFLFSLLNRTPLILDVMRDRNALYREVDGGDRIENIYTLRIINQDGRPHDFRLSVSGIPGVRLVEPSGEVQVGAGSVATMAARLQLPAEQAAGIHTVEFSLTAADARISVRERSRFIGPRS